MSLSLDWAGVLQGSPADWLVSGFVMTLAVSLVASLLASVLAVPLLALRLSPVGPVRGLGRALISAVRDSPLLVQMFFWYFALYPLVPRPLRRWLQDKADVVALPGDVILLSPEALTAVWALAVFTAVYLAEEIRAGLGAVPSGQREAAQSQGLGPWQTLCLVLLPQALANARQPVIGQYLNLMKLSSFASAIGLAEITYQVRQIESFNAHALEAFAVGTALYLGLGLVLARVLDLGRPRWQGAEVGRHGL